MKLIQDRKKRPILNYDKQLYCTCKKCESLFMYGLEDVQHSKKKASGAYRDHRGVLVAGEALWKDVYYVYCPVCKEKNRTHISHFIDGWYRKEETEEYKQYKEGTEKIDVEREQLQDKPQQQKDEYDYLSRIVLIYSFVLALMIPISIICYECC